jgi:hypothetical protein
MNLLDYFVLQHFQISHLHAELLKVSREGAMQEAKVEMNLTPRLLETDAGESLPSYQVSANLFCAAGSNDETGPAFKAKVGIETVYQQTSGEPIDISDFTRHHSGLARQIYPLLARELRGLLTSMGLTHIELPFDLNPQSHKISVSRDRISGQVH